MTMATMTSKGQITIPKDIRNNLLLRNGDKIDFIITDQGEVLLRPLTRRVDDIFGRLHKPDKKLSVADMDSAIRDKVRERSK
ncbi:MAG: AbrB/MazE/SpoVT family DNA-binding domain-containing protein [Anaerolineae bacterium]|nr:AbrB/MazE/SpoVT family DNA-binding domain-containing protein [Anaerolineae bacterium]